MFGNAVVYAAARQHQLRSGITHACTFSCSYAAGSFCSVTCTTLTGSEARRMPSELIATRYGQMRGDLHIRAAHRTDRLQFGL